MTADAARALDRAEKEIQRIVLELVNDYGIRVSDVHVDTRNYANCVTTILWDEPKVEELSR